MIVDQQTLTIGSVDAVKVPPPWVRAGRGDPMAWYAAMLEQGPIARDERSGTMLYLGHEAVRDFLSEPELWSTARRTDRLDEASRSLRLLTSDPPIHRQLRAHFAQAYRPQRIVELEKQTKVACSELLDNCLQRAAFDAVKDFMKPMSLVVICELLGIPEDVRSAIIPLGGNASLGRVAEDTSVPLDSLLYDGKVSGDYLGAIVPIFDELIAERRVHPQDDLVSALAKIGPDELEGRVELPALLFEQFGAGTNTTVHLFASILHELNLHRDLYARVKQDRELVVPIIEETLRLHAPLQARPRVLTREAIVGGVALPEGTWGLGWIASANIDPVVFDAPLEFRLDRDFSKHTTFGRNEHFCLGSHLARMELRVAFNAWLDKVDDFAPDPDGVVWLDDFIIHGLDSYRVNTKAR